MGGHVNVGGGGRLVSIKYAPFIQTEGLCVCVCLYLCVCVNVLRELWFSFEDDMEHSFTCVCMCVGFLHVCVDLCVNVVTKGRWLSFDNICSIHSLCCTTDHGDL